MISRGKTVRIAYDLSADGKLVRCVHSAKPFRYLHGKSDLLPALEKALVGMNVGDRKKILLRPKDGHGPQNPRSIVEMPKTRFPKRDHLVGKEVRSLRDNKYLATVTEVRKNTLILNFNHPLAGKELQYDVQVIGIEGESRSR